VTLRSVVCFFAHPDDETLAAGIIALLAGQNIPVHIVCATRGEGGEMGEPPIVAKRELLGAQREKELRCAVKSLGATLTILDYIDPTVGDDDVLRPFECDFDTLARQFVDIARQRRADLVLTHGGDGEYGHPAHKLVHRAALHGIAAALPKTLVYTVAATVPAIEDHLWNANEPAHLALDIRPWREAKLAVLECHLTQHALFKRKRKLQSVRDSLRTVESVRRAHPPTHDEPPRDAFAQLLLTAGAWEPKG
jgi:LmbE family N-acetylglucosaminyl deacetylase